MVRERARARHATSWSSLILLAVVGVIAAACSVGSDGVLRPVERAEPESGDPLAGGAAATECPALLSALRDAAADLVGPNGFDTGEENRQPEWEFFGGPFPVVRQGVGFVDFMGASTVDLRQFGTDHAVVDGHLVVVREGWLHVVGPDGGSRSSVWLDAPSIQSWPAAKPLVVPSATGVVVVVPAVAHTFADGSASDSTVILRVDLADAEAPTLTERVVVAGTPTALDMGDEVRIAVSAPQHALDFVSATTPGAEEAALEANRAVIAEAGLEAFVPRFERVDLGADVPEPISGVLGGCDVVWPPGARPGAGTTSVFTLPAAAGADIEAVSVLGAGMVAFVDDGFVLASPRSDAVGFGGGASGSGHPRILLHSVRLGDGLPEVDASGIVPGTFAAPSLVSNGDVVAIFTGSFDQFNGNAEQSVAVLETEGEQLRVRDSAEFTAEVSGQSTSVEVFDNDVMGLWNSSGGALVDFSDPDEIDVTALNPRWDRGDRVPAERFVPLWDGLTLALTDGEISNWGGLDQFLLSFETGEFGIGFDFGREFGRSLPVAARIVDGDPLEGAEIAALEIRAFGIWLAGRDEAANTLTLGVLGMVDDEGDDAEAPAQLIGGDSFSGLLQLAVVDGELVERGRVELVAEQPDQFGAANCEEIEIGDGLENFGFNVFGAFTLRCEPGQSGGAVGHTCTSLGGAGLDRDTVGQMFGFRGQLPEELERPFAEIENAEASGARLETCRPVQFGGSVVVREVAPTGDGSTWAIATRNVHLVAPDGTVSASAALEPPYTL